MLDLSIIVPAYNEAERLPATLDALRTFLATRPWGPEIIVVDDGSTDRTDRGRRGRGGRASFPVRVVSLGANRGKGAAVKRAVGVARGAFVALRGCRPALCLRRVRPRDAAARRGRRPRDRRPRSPGQQRGAGIYVDALAPGPDLFGARQCARRRGIPDTQCGFKWFRTAIARELFTRVTLTGFAFDVELLVVAQRWGLRIDRIPVRFTHSDDSRIRLARDSARMLWDLLTVNRRRARGV